ncbi:MAG: hypothetical protein H6980_02495 [Gammaproteobacteria bacterium]|nr:hypothetical protein [Gammaproteobacteria bacterium]
MDITLASALTISAGGAIGGLVLGIAKETSYRIRVIGGKQVELGFIGDAIVGFASAMAFFAFAGPILNIDLTKVTEAHEFIKAIAVSIIAGFGGIGLLQKMTDNLSKQIQQVSSDVEQIKLHEKSSGFLEQALFFRNNNLYEEALLYYDHALKVNPDSKGALLGKGFVLKRLGRINDAWNMVDKLISIEPSHQTAWYNRACYGALLGKEKTQILNDLAKAIELFPTYRSLATKDPDFESLRNDSDFKALTEYRA